MTPRRLRSLVAAGFLLILTRSAFGGDDPRPLGFVPLFNGKDLGGWRIPKGDGGHWRVVNGVIDYDAMSEAPGDKALWSEREFGDYVLRLDWRLKEAPYINRDVPYILPDGTHARDIRGREIRLSVPDADSGVYLRGDGRFQVNIWCWPIGSGEFYGVRTDPRTTTELRAAVTPRTQADRPVGEWNRFEITVRDRTVSVVLNDKLVISGAAIPDLPRRGRLALQHHGARNKQGEWIAPPSLVQFRNIFIKELGPHAGAARPAGDASEDVKDSHAKSRERRVKRRNLLPCGRLHLSGRFNLSCGINAFTGSQARRTDDDSERFMPLMNPATEVAGSPGG